MNERVPNLKKGFTMAKPSYDDVMSSYTGGKDKRVQDTTGNPGSIFNNSDDKQNYEFKNIDVGDIVTSGTVLSDISKTVREIVSNNNIGDTVANGKVKINVLELSKNRYDIEYDCIALLTEYRSYSIIILAATGPSEVNMDLFNYSNNSNTFEHSGISNTLKTLTVPELEGYDRNGIIVLRDDNVLKATYSAIASIGIKSDYMRDVRVSTKVNSDNTLRLEIKPVDKERKKTSLYMNTTKRERDEELVVTLMMEIVRIKEEHKFSIDFVITDIDSKANVANYFVALATTVDLIFNDNLVKKILTENQEFNGSFASLFTELLVDEQRSAAINALNDIVSKSNFIENSYMPASKTVYLDLIPTGINSRINEEMLRNYRNGSPYLDKLFRGVFNLGSYDLELTDQVGVIHGVLYNEDHILKIENLGRNSPFPHANIRINLSELFFRGTIQSTVDALMSIDPLAIIHDNGYRVKLGDRFLDLMSDIGINISFTQTHGKFTRQRGGYNERLSGKSFNNGGSFMGNNTF